MGAMVPGCITGRPSSLQIIGCRPFALRQGQNQVTFKCQHSGGWGQLVVWGWPDGTGAGGDWRVAYSGVQN